MKQSNWVTFLVNGLIAVLFSVLALALPKETVTTVAKYFGLLILIAGVILLVVSIKNMQKDQPFTLLLTEAVAAIILGGVILFYTRQSLSLFVILIGIWAVILGLVQIIISLRFKDMFSNHRLMTINGLLSLIFGVLLFMNPFESAIIMTRITGVIALITGILLIILAFSMKSIKEE
jgi:uncharacterized membrane protein HdeD (DUF308 family)